MNRCKRRTIVSSPIMALAIIALLQPAGWTQTPEQSAGESSEVVRADYTNPATEAEAGSEIQQVAGKQLSGSRTGTSGGLIGGLLGGRESSSSSQPKRSAPAAESSGLLSGLFGDRDTGSSKSRNVTPLPDSTRPPANWDGIPFHEGSGKAKTTASAPLRDSRPGQSENATAAPRPSSQEPTIVRGQTSRTIPTPGASPSPTTKTTEAPTVSSRRAVPQPTESVAKRPTVPIETITKSPTATASPTPRATESGLSTNLSSRRTDRRSVDALDASELLTESTASASPSTQPTKPSVASSNRAISDDIPKVSRRVIPNTTTEQAPQKSLASDTSAPATSELATADANPAPAKPTTPTVEKSAPRVAELQTPPSSSQRRTKPTETSEVAALPNSAPVESKTEEVAQTTPRYNVPVDPETLPPTIDEEPMGSVPAVPYAASAPDVESQFVPRTAVASKANSIPSDSPSPQATIAEPIPFRPDGNVASFRKPELATNRIAQNDAPRTSGIVGSATADNALSAPAVNANTTNSNTAVGGANVPPSLRATTDTNRPATLPSQSIASPRPSEPNPPNTMSELPGIRVSTHGPSQIMIHQTHPYEIRIENRGSMDASGVLVRANIPTWAEVQGSSASRGGVESQTQAGQSERLVWKIDHLPAGSSERMFVRLKAVRSGSHDMDVDWTLAPQKSVAKVYVQEPKLAITIEGPEEVTYGQSKTYKVRISNPGDGLAPNVMFTLSPKSATPQTQRIGDIPAGKEAQIELELSAQDLGDLQIDGIASGDFELRAEAAKTIRVASAKLQATLTGPQLKYQNSDSKYSLRVENTGTAASENVVASLRLPVGVKYLGGFDGAEFQGDLLTWKIESLPPGSVREYQFQCEMTATGDQLFAFDCRGTAAGQAAVSLATRVEAIADLVLTIDDPLAPAPVGTEVVYEIKLRNRGSKEAVDVRAIAQFSHGIEPQRLEGQTGKVMTGQVMFDAIPRIEPNQEIVLRVVAKAETEGHHRFRTEIRSDEILLVAEEATHYMNPSSERVSRRSDERVIK